MAVGFLAVRRMPHHLRMTDGLGGDRSGPPNAGSVDPSIGKKRPISVTC